MRKLRCLHQASDLLQRVCGLQVYYTTPSKKSEGVKGYWCHPCYNEHRGEVIELEGLRVRKVTACFFKVSLLAVQWQLQRCCVPSSLKG